MNDSFVFYKLPDAQNYVTVRQLSDMPKCIAKVAELGGERGFVFAPFAISDKQPILLVRPDVVKMSGLDDSVDFNSVGFKTRDIYAERRKYGHDFRLFHDSFLTKGFSKIVLSRCSEEIAEGDIDLKLLFKRACRLCPHLFVALVSAPPCGAWLMATPEVLLEKKDDYFHTMALAGTRRPAPDGQCGCECGGIGTWSEKNRQEQQYVAKYIRERIGRLSREMRETRPYTFTSANVQHINTDFYFKLNPDAHVGQVLSDLFPTPAVCGIPEEATHRFIVDNESCNRAYYSGFAGMIDNEAGIVRLYVTLRCMQICGNHYKIYAGGGLLEGSDEEAEWLETEAKMNTMRRCLAIE